MNQNTELKLCQKCNNEVLLIHFLRNTKGNLFNTCSDCRYKAKQIYDKQYYEAHKQTQTESNKQSPEEHKEKLKQYYKNNKEKLSQYYKERYQKRKAEYENKQKEQLPDLVKQLEALGVDNILNEGHHA